MCKKSSRRYVHTSGGGLRAEIIAQIRLWFLQVMLVMLQKHRHWGRGKRGTGSHFPPEIFVLQPNDKKRNISSPSYAKRNTRSESIFVLEEKFLLTQRLKIYWPHHVFASGDACTINIPLGVKAVHLANRAGSMIYWVFFIAPQSHPISLHQANGTFRALSIKPAGVIP